MSNSGEQQRIRRRQLEIDNTIAKLYEERRSLSTRLRELKTNERREDMVPVLLELQGQWSVKRPVIEPFDRNSSYIYPVNWGANLGGFYGTAQIVSGKAYDDKKIRIRCDIEFKKATGKIIAKIEIRNPSYNDSGALFTTRKTFANEEAYNKGIAEFYYQAVLKAAHKLVNKDN